MKKVVLITGAASGIGKGAALLFARKDYVVVLSDYNGVQLEETLKELEELVGADCCSSFVADVSKEDQVKGMINHVESKFGRLDAAFNCAGIPGVKAGVSKQSLENWQRTIDINLTGVFLCSKYESELMLKTLEQDKEESVAEQVDGQRTVPRMASIVNCSSVGGKIGMPTFPAYCAAKHGVLGLTKSMAVEFAKKGIRVNAVCPGVVETAMIQDITAQESNVDYILMHRQHLGRMAKPVEVAGAVVWLCSDEASMVTGAALEIDGGWLAA